MSAMGPGHGAHPWGTRGWEEGEGLASGTAGVWQQWPHMGGLAHARRGLQARPPEAAVRKLAKVGHSPVSFGTGSESGLDAEPFGGLGCCGSIASDGREQGPGQEVDARDVIGMSGWSHGGLAEAVLRPAELPVGPGGMGAGAAGREGASPSGPADLHLSALERVVEALPLGPVDAIGVGEVGATQVEAVEVGEVAAAEPEGTRGERCAVLHEEVLVSVEGGELLAAVVGQ